jgi:hypothetical protein
MRWLAAGSLVLTLSAPLPSMAQAGSVYYVCPGNVFTNTLSAKEAAQKGCKAKEATEPTTISGPKPRRHLPRRPVAQASRPGWTATSRRPVTAMPSASCRTS